MNNIILLFIIPLLIFSCLGIALLIISYIRKQQEINYLSLSFILRAIFYIAPTLMTLGIGIEWSAWITGPIKVLLIPLTYIYIHKSFELDKTFKRKDLIHFLPFLIDLILTLIIASNHSLEIVNHNQIDINKAMATIWEENFYYTLLSTTARGISFIQLSIYSFLIIPLVKKCIHIQKNEASIINQKYNRWLKGITFIFIFLGVFEGFAIFGIYKYPVLFFLFFLFVLFYGVYLFLFVVLFSKEFNFLATDTLNEEKDYDPSVEKHNHEWLMTFLNKEMYLDPDLTLQKTSMLLNMPKYRLSQIIHDDGYSTFYSFVNFYRVEKSKDRLRQLPDSLAIESVINESGFKSRSTYFRVFKEYTGITPGKYLESTKETTTN